MKEEQNKPESVETVKVKNPFTGNSKEIAIDRRGMDDNRFLSILSSDADEDTKMLAVSDYFFQNNKDALGMVGELMRYKGTSLKETRKFKSVMRSDFEFLVSMLSGFFADRSSEMLSILLTSEQRKGLSDYIKKHSKEGKTSAKLIAEWTEKDFPEGNNPQFRAMLALASRFYEEAGTMTDKVREMEMARMKDKGYGNYVDVEGETYQHDSYGDPDKQGYGTTAEKVGKKVEENRGHI